MRIHWSPDQERHIATRSQRYGPHADDLRTQWTQEAVNDPEAVTDPIEAGTPYKRRTTGFSPGYGGLITVLYLDLDGHFEGITAYPAS